MSIYDWGDKLKVLTVRQRAQVWAELNKHQWPDIFRDLKPAEFRNEVGVIWSCESAHQLWLAVNEMTEMKDCLREWNRENMNDEQFEAWYCATFTR